MGANLWGASPLWEYRLGLIVSKDNHEPTARAIPRGNVRRKPECKRCEATDRNRIQGRGLRGELAHDSKAHRYAPCRPRRANGPALRQAQTVHWTVCVRAQPTVNAALVHRQFASLTWGDLRRERRALMVTNPASDHTGIPRSRRRGELPAASDEAAAITTTRAARRAATRGVTEQKSADAVVGSPGVGPPKG